MDHIERDSPEFVIGYLAEIEELGEEILAEKRQLLDLDRKKNENRVAIRALLQEEQHHQSAKQKTWLCFGDIFLKFPKSNIVALLKEDQMKIEEEIAHLRESIKCKVERLNEKEGKDKMRGFFLNSLSRDELTAIKKT